MSKSDEIRRMREQQHAQRERQSAERPSAPPPAQAPSAPRDEAPQDEAPQEEGRPEAAPRAPRGRPASEEQGRCSACGKIRPLVNGLIAVHQKGLGKICPGSRKEPA